MAAPILAVDRLDFRLRPMAWAFAETRRAEIAEHFRKARAARPALWNGRVLLMHEHTVSGGVFGGAYFETDFSAFLAWRDWGCPDPSVSNAFAQAVIRSGDGAFLLGVMGEQTANAGKIYFPSGTPDPSDLVGDTVDLAGNLMRELTEETGLTECEVTLQPGWTVVLGGPAVALMRTVQASESAEALRARILAHLAGEAEPELADIRIVRSRADLDPAMPDFVVAFLEQSWGLGDS